MISCVFTALYVFENFLQTHFLNNTFEECRKGSYHLTHFMNEENEVQRLEMSWWHGRSFQSWFSDSIFSILCSVSYVVGSFTVLTRIPWRGTQDKDLCPGSLSGKWSWGALRSEGLRSDVGGSGADAREHHWVHHCCGTPALDPMRLPRGLVDCVSKLPSIYILDKG